MKEFWNNSKGVREREEFCRGKRERAELKGRRRRRRLGMMRSCGPLFNFWRESVCVFGGECEPLDTGMDGDGSWRESIRAWSCGQNY